MMKRVTFLAWFLLMQALVSPSLFSSEGPLYYTSTRRVASLALCGDTLWGASEGGILELNLTHRLLIKHTPPEPGILLPVTFAGVYRGKPVAAYLAAGKNLISLEEGRAPVEETLPEATGFTSMTVQGDGLFIATVDGIWERKKEEWAFYPIPRGSHISCLQGGNGRIIAALPGEGLFQFREGAWKALTMDLTDTQKEITCVIEHKGSFCWGTDHGGITIAANNQADSYMVEGELTENSVTSLARYRDWLYCSTFEGNLERLGAQGWEEVPGSPSRWIRQLTVCNGFLWLRDADGKLFHHDGTTFLPVNLKPAWTSFIYSEGSRLIVGGYGGLFM